MPSPKQTCVFFWAAVSFGYFFRKRTTERAITPNCSSGMTTVRAGVTMTYGGLAGRCQDKTVYHIQQDHRQDIFTDFHL